METSFRAYVSAQIIRTIQVSPSMAYMWTYSTIILHCTKKKITTSNAFVHIKTKPIPIGGLHNWRHVSKTTPFWDMTASVVTLKMYCLNFQVLVVNSRIFGGRGGCYQHLEIV